MKRLTVEATDENILNSIKDNTYYRNPDVKNFIEAFAYGHFLRPAGPHFPDSLGHIKRTAQ